jgi:hypothetical protein
MDLEPSSESWERLEKEGKPVDRHGTGDQARSKAQTELHSLGSLRTQWYLFPNCMLQKRGRHVSLRAYRLQRA